MAGNYIKPLLVTFVFLVVVSIFFLVGPITEPAFTTLFPFNSLSIQAILIFISLIVGTLVGIVLGWILGPVLLVLHATLVTRKKVYDIKTGSEQIGFKGFKRAFYPSLMAISIALNFATMPEIKAWLLDPAWLGSPGGAADASWPFVTLILLLIFTITISTGLFSGVWLLLETGLIYQTKETDDISSGPAETRSVGGWYRSIFGGYAGVGAIIGFYTFALIALSSDVHISIPAFLIPMPIILMILSAPALILFDMTSEQRVKKLVELAGKYMKSN
ncbi:MAG: hypothetical protein ACFFED_11565 [Candidatus Thorarchaeota archaeon]